MCVCVCDDMLTEDDGRGWGLYVDTPVRMDDTHSLLLFVLGRRGGWCGFVCLVTFSVPMAE